MGVLFPFFIVLLCFILKTSEISGEKCDTVKYKIPETIFRTNNETTRMCKSNSDKVSHSVINDNFGEISLNVTLNTSLSVGEYIFELYWNCDNFFHTKQRFVVCSDKCNASVYTPCANEFVFNITYVFSGIYCVKLKDEGEKQIWSSKNFTVTTNYTKVSLDDTKPTSGACIVKSVKNHLEADVVIQKAIFLKPPPLKIILASQNVTKNLEDPGITSDEICYPNFTYTCSSIGYNYSCTYFDVASGTYKILGIIDDPRCNSESLWTNNPLQCVFITDCASIAPVEAPNDSKLKLIIVCILVVVFGYIIYVSIKKYKSMTARNKRSLNARYTVQITDEGNEFLIIHARESEEFERVVEMLKQLLTCGYSSQVTTLYELDQKCLAPEKWLQDKLRDDNVKIILVLNVASVYACDKNYVYGTPHCFDFLFPYALKLLKSYEQRSYHNLYKVLTPEANSEKFRFINTLTEFNLPQHTDDFLSELRIPAQECENYKDDFNNECNAYRDYILHNEEYLKNIFYVKK